MRSHIFILLIMVSLLSACGASDQQKVTEESPKEEKSEDGVGAVPHSSPAVDLPSVSIGEQTWTSANLEVETFRNGDPIPHIEDEQEWEKAGREGRAAWCYFNNDPDMGALWGKIYNFHAVVDERGLAPAGWHVPTEAEFEQLEEALGGASKAATPLKELPHWDESTTGSPSGFNARPSRGRFDDGPFIDLPDIGYWWSQTPHKDGRRANYIAMSLADPSTTIWALEMGYGFAVRLVKD